MLLYQAFYTSSNLPLEMVSTLTTIIKTNWYCEHIISDTKLFENMIWKLKNTSAAEFVFAVGDLACIAWQSVLSDCKSCQSARLSESHCIKLHNPVSCSTDDDEVWTRCYVRMYEIHMLNVSSDDNVTSHCTVFCDHQIGHMYYP
jgi:hypothetical protein